MDDWAAKVEEAVSLLRSAGRAVCFVGAGASASAGVPTFRGTAKAESLLDVREDGLCVPNVTHRSIMRLLREGVLAGVVSSNHDGLVAGDGVVEIFGSVLTETCLACKARFRRRHAPPALGRTCEACGGKLKKTGCRYGQAIYKPGLEQAALLSEGADVALVLGSGMHTWPLSVNGFPFLAKRVVLCTLGETAADGCEEVLRFDATCDAFMAALMERLGVEVPAGRYEEQYRVRWRREAAAGGHGLVSVVVESAEGANESLCFAQLGSVNGIELERNSKTYALEATVPNAARLQLQLQPRPELDDSRGMVECNVSCDGDSGSTSFFYFRDF